MKKHLVKYYFKLYRVLKFKGFNLRTKILINHIAVLMIPVIVIFYFIFNVYINDKKDEALKLIRLVNRQAMDIIDSYMIDLDELTKQPLYDSNSNITSVVSQEPDILQILRDSNNTVADSDSIISSNGKDGQILSTNNKPLGNSIEETSAVRKVLYKISTFKKAIHSVFIFNKSGDRSEWIMHDNAIVTQYDPSNEDWFKQCLELNGSPLIAGTTRFKDIVYQKGDSKYFFSVSRAVKDLASTEIIGVISIYTSVEYLKDICYRIKSAEDERILILNEDDLIVYDINEDNIMKSIHDKDVDLNDTGIFGSAGLGSFGMIKGRKYLVESVESGVSGWKLVRALPEESIYKSVQDIQRNFLILTLIFVFLSLILSVGITYGITQPLKKLINMMKVVGKGDLSIRFRVRYKDEIGQLGRSFNRMIHKIDRLVNIVYLSQVRKKEAELSALQAQINPHFIYNTLESIRMMAELNDDVSTSKMILILGKLLRYSISSKNQVVTVKQEIDHLNNYIKLQNFRFQNKFDIEIDILPELYDVSIIKLIFQPIVENSIFHGLETLQGKGLILIKGYHYERGIAFDIYDNGIGMTEKQVEELTQKTNDFTIERKNSRSIGLRNVNERIKLYYGEGYGIKIFSELGRGTRVTLELPIREAMDNLQI